MILWPFASVLVCIRTFGVKFLNFTTLQLALLSFYSLLLFGLDQVTSIFSISFVLSCAFRKIYPEASRYSGFTSFSSLSFCLVSMFLLRLLLQAVTSPTCPKIFRGISGKFSPFCFVCASICFQDFLPWFPPLFGFQFIFLSFVLPGFNDSARIAASGSLVAKSFRVVLYLSHFFCLYFERNQVKYFFSISFFLPRDFRNRLP